jgi:ATP-dependent exoDNAse (exonuclease V) alpha subunit
MLALYFLHLKLVSKKTGGSPLKSAAYMSGIKLYSERDGTSYNFKCRHDVLHTEILLPKDAPPEFSSQQVLWNQVEHVESRSNARFAREFILALPRELVIESSKKLVREFVEKCLLSIGMCADIAIHTGHNKNFRHIEAEQDVDSLLHNPHCHILVTDRPVTNKGFSSKKNRKWNDTTLLYRWRKEWANIQNRMFARKGIAERVSHESYKTRGIDKEPTKHLGPILSELERRGIQTDIGNANREIEVRNKERQRMHERKRTRSIEHER